MNEGDKKLINELFSFCLDIHGDNFCVFFAYDAHVSEAEIRIFVGGWNKGKSADYHNRVILDKKYQKRSTSQQVKNVIGEIKGLSLLFSENEVA